MFNTVTTSAFDKPQVTTTTTAALHDYIVHYTQDFNTFYIEFSFINQISTITIRHI